MGSETISYPLDTVKRRMMMQSARGDILYKNSIECTYMWIDDDKDKKATPVKMKFHICMYMKRDSYTCNKAWLGTIMYKLLITCPPINVNI